MINSDFSRRIVIATAELPWLPSPQEGVERRMLDRIGDEVARATSLVRYAPGSRFSAHVHALGEEFFVLAGEFADEHGTYPAGTYVRNPPGSRHTPLVTSGCSILVKLRQMPLSETRRLVVDTGQADWTTAAVPGLETMCLYRSDTGPEDVSLNRLAPDTTLPAYDNPDGEELFILYGDLSDEHGSYQAETWIRNPPGFRHSLQTRGGALYWAKRGHLAPAEI